MNTWTRITEFASSDPFGCRGPRDRRPRTRAGAPHSPAGRDGLRDRTDVVDREQHLSLDPTREPAARRSRFGEESLEMR